MRGEVSWIPLSLLTSADIIICIVVSTVGQVVQWHEHLAIMHLEGPMSWVLVLIFLWILAYLYGRYKYQHDTQD